MPRTSVPRTNMYPKHMPEDCVTVYDKAKAYNGYTIFANHSTTDLWMINMNGEIVHHWKMPNPLASGVMMLPNGNHLRINRTWEEPSGFLGSVGSQLVEVDWDGNVVWKYEDLYMHHDFEPLPNGNFMLNRHVKIPHEVAKKVKGGVPNTEKDGVMWGEALREITPDGKTVWEWFAYEHLDPEIDVPCPICPRNCWGYVNGIDVFDNGDILLSFRYENNLMIVDKKTGDIKWRWGKWELGHQHDPNILDNGNILVFDNQYHTMPQWNYRYISNLAMASRILEINPKTNKIEWEYKDPEEVQFCSMVQGSDQRMPNGNTVICESQFGRIFEVTKDKELVWEFVSPFYVNKERWGWTNSIFKVLRVGNDIPGLKDKDLDPARYKFEIVDTGKPTKEEKPASQQDKISKRMARLGY